MMTKELEQKVLQLAHYIESKHFEPITQRTPYYHMGATITDSILQAGLNYKNVVYPRIYNLLSLFAEYKTTSDFIILMQTIPLRELIKWNNEKKLGLINQLAWIFYKKGMQNEDQLALWLEKDEHIEFLLGIKGIGPKTVDYLKMLSGCQSIAIDRHLFQFLRLANIITESYQEAHAIYQQAANLLCMSNYELDKKIWLYMSK